MSDESSQRRALTGLRVLDFSRLGPGPYLTMLLADHGADVLVVQRPSKADDNELSEPRTSAALREAPLYRGKDVATIDLKDPRGLRLALDLAEQADVVVESFRPGVMDHLGLGANSLCEANPLLVYCSITGYGQDGPLAREPGHDPNFLALSGLLEHVGATRPELPLNVVGDFAAGGLLGAFGVLLALQARASTGRGQHIDVSMTEGVLSLLTLHFGLWSKAEPARGAGRFSGSEPYHAVYETSDEQFVTIGAAEDRFRRNVNRLVGLDAPSDDPAELRAQLGRLIRQRSRDAWSMAAEGREACLSPVLSLREAAAHPHFLAREAVIAHPTALVPGPVPRLTETPAIPGEPGRRALASPAAAGRLGPFAVDAVQLRALTRDGVLQ